MRDKLMNKKSNSRLHSLIRNRIVSCKRSQVTIFIIIAIVIVALLIIIFYPRIQTTFFTPKTPQGFIEDCMQEDIETNLAILKKQGGILEPENFILYQDNKISYLCYTNEYYKTCVMQEPFIKERFEEELKLSIEKKAGECVNSLVEDYEKKGYSVSSKKPEVSVELVPGSIKIEINSGLTITKESTESYNKILIVKESGIYDLLMISESILNYEARLGDSNPETYMYYYPDLKIEKFKQGDGSKIYMLTDRETEEKFVFASRSLSWPAGYNVNQEVVK